VEIVIDAASYTTDSGARDRDVRENALEAHRFPTIRFESTGLSTVEDGRDAARLGLRGKLTLHGVTREIEVPVAAKLDPGGRLLAEGTYVFKFEEYGVKRPSKMMGLMTTGDEAKIDFHIVADPV
jgi:polyisoprenoid-binding protein YceI